MTQDKLSRIHEGHLGVKKCKTRARGAVFWPGINRDIEWLISRYETCQKHRNRQTKLPMVVTEVPTAPWHKVGMDLFHLKDQDYLVVTDYYSNFPEMVLLLNTSSVCVITHWKSIFARCGIPNTVMSDNAPCFNSREWHDFAEQYDFRHMASSPLYAHSEAAPEESCWQRLRSWLCSPELQSITTGVQTLTCWTVYESKTMHHTAKLHEAK